MAFSHKGWSVVVRAPPVATAALAASGESSVSAGWSSAGVRPHPLLPAGLAGMTTGGAKQREAAAGLGPSE